MTPVKEQTDQQIRLRGFQVLRKELGVVGLLRFLQQFDPGNGDYVNDRDEWQQEYTVETLAEAIAAYTTHSCDVAQKEELS